MKNHTEHERENFDTFWDITSNNPKISKNKFIKIGILNLTDTFRLNARRWFSFWSVEEPEVDQSINLDFQLLDALNRRKSTRDFSNRSILRSELMTLMKPCLATTNNRIGTPSAGALYSIDAYIVCRNCADMEPGIYYWRSGAQDLIFLRPLCEASDISTKYNSPVHQNVSAIIFLVSRINPVFEKYGLRSIRLLLLEAGHFSQSLWLLATSLNLGFLIRDDFFDQDIARYLGIHPANQRTLVSIMLGGTQSSLGVDSIDHT